MLNRVRPHEKGNILFLILLAVVLFAALSYAVTSSMRGGGNDATAEQTEMAVSEVLNYAAQVEAAVQRVSLSNGCGDTQISFQNDFVNQYTNPNAPGRQCWVFDPAGGGVVFQTPPTEILVPQSEYQNDGYGHYIYTGGLSFRWIGTYSGTDLAFILKGLNSAACALINKRLYGDSTIPEHETWAWGPLHAGTGDFFRGTYKTWSAAATLSYPASSFLTGQSAGCFKVWGGNNYVYFSILKVR